MVERRRSFFRRFTLDLLERLHRLAESGWGGAAAFLWAMGQSSIVPGPSEALLIPLGLADPPAAWRLGAWTFAGTIIGGLVAFAIGVLAFDAVGAPLLALVRVGPDELESLHSLFDERGAAIVVVSAMTPVSTKVVSIAAGAFGVPPWEFVAALVVARGGRIGVVTALLRYAGEPVRAYLLRRLGRAVPVRERGTDFDAGR